MSKIKVVQSRLKRRGVEVSSEEIRNAIASTYGDCEDSQITEEMVVQVVEKFLSTLTVKAPSTIALSEQEKLITSVASDIDVSLPIEAIGQIATSIDWAIQSRSALMQELRSAIRAWSKQKLEEAHKISEDIRNETNQLFAEASSTINEAIAADNEQFTQQAQALKNQMSTAVEKFRSSQKAILDIFKIAN